jgi:hypothetical protein
MPGSDQRAKDWKQPEGLKLKVRDLYVILKVEIVVNPNEELNLGGLKFVGSVVKIFWKF